MQAAATPAQYDFSRDTGHDPTTLFRSTARPLWDRIMADYGSFDSIALSDLVGDNSLVLMSTFANRMANNPPVSPTRKALFSTATLKQSLVSLCTHLKEKFRNEIAQRNLDLFPDVEIGKWKKIIQDGRNRTTMEGEEESDLFKNTFPIPPVHSVRTRLAPWHDFQNEQHGQLSRQVDLLHLCKKMFEREQFTEMAKLVLSYKAIGRGGEVKFLSYKRMFFDDTYNMCFTQWFQRKNLKSSPLGFAPQYDHPETCAFLALGCYWSCDQGLIRPDGVGVPGTATDRNTSFVFPDLHDINDDSVATQLGNIIKSLIPQQLRKFYSIKSFRYGAMTFLTIEPCVSYEESVALGGWATESNSKWYTWTYLCAIVPAVLALAGYPDPRVVAHIPSCSMLFNAGDPNSMTPQKFASFVTELFPNSLREFQPPHGRLRPLMVRVAAVMIMHFAYFYNQYGSNHGYSSALIGATIRSELADSVTEAINKLQHWSRLVRDDFKRGNPMSAGSGACDLLGRRTLMDEVSQVTSNVGKLLSEMAEAQAAITRNFQQQQASDQSILTLHASVRRLVDQQDQLSRQNIMILQQLQRLLNRPPAQANHSVEGDTEEQEEEQQVIQQQVQQQQQQQHQEQQEPQQAQQPTHALRPLGDVLMKARVNLAGTKGKAKKSETIEAMFKAMHNDPNKSCFNSMRSGAGPALSDQATWVHDQLFDLRDGTKSKIVKTMMFVDCFWTKEEREKIINQNFPDVTSAYQLYRQISRRVIKALHVMKVPLPTKLEPSNRSKDGILGICNNITKIKALDPLEDWVPDWSKDGTNKKPCTLIQFSAQKHQQLQEKLANNNSNDTNGNNGRTNNSGGSNGRVRNPYITNREAEQRQAQRRRHHHNRSR